MQIMVEVTQADRDAALDLDERHIIQVWNIDATARAFAEHRMRAVEAQAAEIERLQDALKRIAGGWPKPMQLARETLEKKK
jgi:hypothetical protein